MAQRIAHHQRQHGVQEAEDGELEVLAELESVPNVVGCDVEALLLDA